MYPSTEQLFNEKKNQYFANAYTQCIVNSKLQQDAVLEMIILKFLGHFERITVNVLY